MVIWATVSTMRPFKTADIGISVSNATDVAKDVADIILMRKDLVVLKEGILEGRENLLATP